MERTKYSSEPAGLLPPGVLVELDELEVVLIVPGLVVLGSGGTSVEDIVVQRALRCRQVLIQGCSLVNSLTERDLPNSPIVYYRVLSS